jgi:glycosyltransferase involved in cell wall biosynthesis
MGQFIGEAIESVLEQSFANFEIVIQDNASTDDTQSVVRRYDDRRIRYFRNESNLGMYANANLACNNAKGLYIKTFCADDTLSPICLEAIHKVLSQDVSSPKLLAIQQSSLKHELITQHSKLIAGKIPANSFSELFSGAIGTGLPNLCVERDFFLREGQFGKPQPDVDFSRDCIAFLGLFLKCGCSVIHGPLTFERPHPSQNRFALKKINQLEEYLRFLTTHKAEISQNPANLQAWDTFLKGLVANHMVSALKPILKQRDFRYLKEMRRILRHYGFGGLPYRAALVRLFEVLRSRFAGIS